MAKRFTDTEKFTDPWYRRLSSKHKLFWEYLLCACDHAGIISVDLEFIEMVLKEKYEDNVIAKYFSDRVEKLAKPFEYFIPKFVTFQYGELSSKSPMHLKVIRTLKAAGINPDTLSTGYKQGINTLEEEEEEEREREEEVKEEEEVKASVKQTRSRKKKEVVIAELSPLESASLEADINKWLRTGNPKLQEKLLDLDPDYLNEAIEKAYYWQLENKKRSAGTFLTSWVDRDKDKKYKGGLTKGEKEFKNFMDGVAAEAKEKINQDY